MLNLYKVREHFVPEIGDSAFEYRREPDSIDHEAAPCSLPPTSSKPGRAHEFELDTQMSAKQARAPELLKGIRI